MNQDLGCYVDICTPTLYGNLIDIYCELSYILSFTYYITFALIHPWVNPWCSVYDRIDIWLSKEAIAKWYKSDQQNIGDGTPRKYTDFAIRICHEIRLVYKQPLRQT
ncbi:transposase [Francisella tularensis subsp. novicida]|nr:transposase [Francisella tularensis subsp. novicida]